MSEPAPKLVDGGEMEKTKGNLRYVETKTATVKMTGGTPFRVGSSLSSSSEEDIEDSHSADKFQGTQITSSVNGLASITHDDKEKQGKSDVKDESSKDLYSNLGSEILNSQNINSNEKAVDNNERERNSLECSQDGEHLSSQPISISHKERTLSNNSQPFRSDVQPSSFDSMNSNPRINPFNKELMVDEEHFSETAENYFIRPGRSTDSFCSSSGFDWQYNVEESHVTFAELGLSEDHFSHPQGLFGLSGTEELELAIENCKDLIRTAQQGSEKQRNLVLKLVQLRVKLQEVKEGPEPVAAGIKVIMSHKMQLKNSRTSKYYCERCNGSIWGMLQAWYKCMECGFRCHEKCLPQIMRGCAKAKVQENPVLCMDMCPVEPNGLAAQNYRCAECRAAISNKSGGGEPRLCDYSGRYFCELCHWNDTFRIPARILHNWDFTLHKVCRASKQFLRLMQKKAVIRIQDINPMLFVYVDQLNEIKKLREEMMIMKKYILACTSAMKAKLLLQLQTRQHFVENSDIYSMQDLLDTEDVLLPELIKVHSSWAQHIKVDCELCQGRGFCCELCHDDEILFPFDNTAVVCAKCSSVLHRHCFAKKGICPRCERRNRRKMDES